MKIISHLLTNRSTCKRDTIDYIHFEMSHKMLCRHPTWQILSWTDWQRAKLRGWESVGCKVENLNYQFFVSVLINGREYAVLWWRWGGEKGGGVHKVTGKSATFLHLATQLCSVNREKSYFFYFCSRSNWISSSSLHSSIQPAVSECSVCCVTMTDSQPTHSESPSLMKRECLNQFLRSQQELSVYFWFLA